MRESQNIINQEDTQMKKCFLVWLGFMLLLQTAGCGFGQNSEKTIPEYVLTYAENQPEDYPTTKGAYYFADLVSERTGGKVEIRVRANGVLGDEQDIVAQIRFGGVDFSRVSLSSIDGIPRLNVLQLPYLYTDAEHMWRVLDGDIGNSYMKDFSGSDIVPLSWYDAGARSFYTSHKPITCLEDMAGMRIRVQDNEMMKSMVELLGATPVPLGYAEVYSAFEKGEIDGAENNWPSYESVNHYEVAKLYCVDEHTRVPELQIISQVTWDKLPVDYQKAIQECALESALYERKLWAEREEKSREKVIQAGTQVIELSPEEKKKFREAVSSLYEKYCADYMDVINDILNEGEKE